MARGALVGASVPHQLRPHPPCPTDLFFPGASKQPFMHLQPGVSHPSIYIDTNGQPSALPDVEGSAVPRLPGQSPDPAGVCEYGRGEGQGGSGTAGMARAGGAGSRGGDGLGLDGDLLGVVFGWRAVGSGVWIESCWEWGLDRGPLGQDGDLLGQNGDLLGSVGSRWRSSNSRVWLKIQWQWGSGWESAGSGVRMEIRWVRMEIRWVRMEICWIRMEILWVRMEICWDPWGREGLVPGQGCGSPEVSLSQPSRDRSCALQTRRPSPHPCETSPWSPTPPCRRRRNGKAGRWRGATVGPRGCSQGPRPPCQRRRT